MIRDKTYQSMLSWLKRMLSLQCGLLLFGLGLALMVKSHLGVDPWTVFHLGASKRFNISLPFIIQFSGLFFLGIAWSLLRQPIGLGTLCNMIFVGPWLAFFLPYVPASDSLIISWSELAIGLIIFGFATALYMTADFGAGPRDSFVFGLSHRTGISIKHIRLGFEFFALSLGYLLDGPVGLGTIFFTLAIGPLMQFFLKLLRKPHPKTGPEDKPCP